MRTFFSILPIIICCLLMAAHLLRADLLIIAIICLAVPFFLLWKNKIAARITQIILILFSIEWLRTLIFYVRIRISINDDWLRLAVILGLVVCVNLASILVFRSKHMKEKYKLS